MFFTPSTHTCRRDDCKKFFLFNQASKFDEAKLEDKARSEYALTQIGLLHDIEEMADEQQLSYKRTSRPVYTYALSADADLQEMDRGRYAEGYAQKSYNQSTELHL